ANVPARDTWPDRGSIRTMDPVVVPVDARPPHTRIDESKTRATARLRAAGSCRRVRSTWNWITSWPSAAVALGRTATGAGATAVATGPESIDVVIEVCGDAEPNGDTCPHAAKASDSANADPAQI